MPLSEQLARANNAQYEEQKKAVYALVVQEGVFQPTVLHAEVEWCVAQVSVTTDTLTQRARYYGGLGLEDYYFRHFSPATIARHLHTFIAAKKLATVSGAGEEVRINYESKVRMSGGGWQSVLSFL